MKRCFVFCHGLGFDRKFWANLAPYFINEDCIYLDLGYFGEECDLDTQVQNVQLIGIGHSLGFLKLLNLKQDFKYLIGLNGFVNFLGNDPTLKQQRTLELQTLVEHFNAMPFITLKSFYRRCGMPSVTEDKKIEAINKQKILHDLKFISSKFNVPSIIPLLIIGSKEDAVVPSKLIYDNFENCQNANICIMDKGSHNLGFLEPEVVYQKIMGFLNENE